MDNILKKSVGSLATQNYSVLQLFLTHKIDFYCKGTLSLEEALDETKINRDLFLKELKSILKGSKSEFNVKIEKWPLDLLADYIQKTHHKFTDKVLVTLKTDLNSFIEADEKVNEKINDFKIQLELLAKELGGHMKKEELILFPYIRRMMISRGQMEKPHFKSVENPIKMMIHEHDTAFNLLQNIRSIFNGYNVSDSNSIELNNIIRLMENLDQDLAIHLHLENNILFPNVIELEKNKLNL